MATILISIVVRSIEILVASFSVSAILWNRLKSRISAQSVTSIPNKIEKRVTSIFSKKKERELRIIIKKKEIQKPSKPISSLSKVFKYLFEAQTGSPLTSL